MLHTPQPLQAREIVRLLSGGPTMTITSVQADDATCMWFERGVSRHGTFPVAALERVPRSTGPVIRKSY